VTSERQHPLDAHALVRVMICDDHDVVANGLASVLSAERDVDVIAVVGSVAEAIATARRCRPDVVLMDYELPDGDGVAATAAIKAAHPETAVVMLTSFGNEAVLVAAIEAGVSGFITKHKSAGDLVAAVRLAAAGESLVAPDLLARLLPRLSGNQRLGPTDLTRRELDVLALLADGATNEIIAERLTISRNTVRNHVQNILSKLGAHSRLEAVAIAAKQGLVHRPG
jgi:DNA-binding NarL/FixJ family response regulator